MLSVLFLSGFLSKVNADAKTAYACSDTSGGVRNDCILFDIRCGNDERIQIYSAFYGFRNSNPDGCKTGRRNCRKEDGCCFAASGDNKTVFSQGHKYSVYQACSWTSRCKRQTPIGHDSEGSSKYSFLTYGCVKGMMIYQCYESVERGVQWYFKGTL